MIILTLRAYSIAGSINVSIFLPLVSSIIINRVYLLSIVKTASSYLVDRNFGSSQLRTFFSPLQISSLEYIGTIFSKRTLVIITLLNYDQLGNTFNSKLIELEFTKVKNLVYQRDRLVTNRVKTSGYNIPNSNYNHFRVRLSKGVLYNKPY